MLPPAGYIKDQPGQQLTMMMMCAPWVVPQYYWATACGLWLMNCNIMLEALAATAAPAKRT